MKNPVTIAFTVALPFLLSCRSQMHTLRSTSHTDTVMTVSIHRDSIYVRDSTVTELRNETVFVDRIRYEYRNRIITDTVFRHSQDTVYTSIRADPAPSGSGENLRSTLSAFTLLAAMITVLILALKKK